MGYHLRPITPRGKYGEISKLEEEVDEIKEAIEQKNMIMVLCELSDLYGAMEGFLEHNFPGMTMEDVKTMSAATKRAFEDGDRD